MPPQITYSQMINAIVGFEIDIVQLKGKWKISQNRSLPDKDTLVAGRAQHGHDEMAALIQTNLTNLMK